MHLAEDWGQLEHRGIDVDGVRVYPILLGLKADWSYHVSWLYLYIFFETKPEYKRNEGGVCEVSLFTALMVPLLQKVFKGESFDPT